MAEVPMPRRNIFSFLSHFFAGVATSLSILVSPILPPLLFIVFIIYELDEDWHMIDEAYIDIRQYAYGLYLTSIFLLILKFLTLTR